MSDDELGFCPLFKEICYGQGCQWWIDHGGECSIKYLGLLVVMKLEIIRIDTEPYMDLDD